jgi:hypothetical protein
MGVFTAEIELFNEDDEALVRRGYLAPTDTRHELGQAVVDSGATMLVIPAAIATRLGVNVPDNKLPGIADGSVIECDIGGHLKVRVGDRFSAGSALAVPGRSSVLLGALMEEMDIIIDPLAGRLIPNPRSPERAMVFAVGAIVHGPVPR